MPSLAPCNGKLASAMAPTQSHHAHDMIHAVSVSAVPLCWTRTYYHTLRELSGCLGRLCVFVITDNSSISSDLPAISLRVHTPIANNITNGHPHPKLPSAVFIRGDQPTQSCQSAHSVVAIHNRQLRVWRCDSFGPYTVRQPKTRRRVRRHNRIACLCAYQLHRSEDLRNQRSHRQPQGSQARIAGSVSRHCWSKVGRFEGQGTRRATAIQCSDRSKLRRFCQRLLRKLQKRICCR